MADEKLVKRMKLEKLPTFKKKLHKIQFKFNEEVRGCLESTKCTLQESNPDLQKAKKALEELRS